MGAGKGRGRLAGPSCMLARLALLGQELLRNTASSLNLSGMLEGSGVWATPKGASRMGAFIHQLASPHLSKGFGGRDRPPGERRRQEGRTRRNREEGSNCLQI